MKSVCVFSGSQRGADPVYAEAARDVAAYLATAGHRLIYGGGSVGLMGEMADVMLQNDAEVIGVIPETLARVELLHAGVPDMRVVANMHERKALMHELADGYIAMPGGYGTLEELFEALCWAQLDIHTAPVAILNVNGYYNGLIAMIDRMVDDGFLNHPHRSILYVAQTVEELTGWLRRLSVATN